MIYLTLEDLLHVARRTLGSVDVRDMGLLESAVARPRTTVFGDDGAYDFIIAMASGELQEIAAIAAVLEAHTEPF
ncbi:hypothetical protein NPS01_16590 [Nocardioides psychrotolerans]|uniref:Death on curing protein n=1 Tax=Nocardioides psychrotolerans TaxID=1005945 RepID=A0A1I3IGJ8_9ACTN|nr:hypothetical protein [Nocardioides psychrotolerans]GEP37996.1 hypothetical protein NPS01_16590 [Nocardioides psychrotolerans]SFI47155.1 death on curing protein [Nocardioides psychrotolerans]